MEEKLSVINNIKTNKLKAILKTIKLKTTCSKGETLVESLAAILLIVISLLGFYSMLMASSEMMKTSNEIIKDFYENTNQLEQRKDSVLLTNGTVKITDEEYNMAQIEVTMYKVEGNALTVYDVNP